MHEAIMAQYDTVHWGVLDLFGDGVEGFGDFYYNWNIRKQAPGGRFGHFVIFYANHYPSPTAEWAFWTKQ
jgi:hypothetical protein